MRMQNSILWESLHTCGGYAYTQAYTNTYNTKNPTNNLYERQCSKNVGHQKHYLKKTTLQRDTTYKETTN